MKQRAAEEADHYIFEEAEADQERRRLRALEAIFDPASYRRLAVVGKLTGKRCLEVGAGAGSIARWLAEQAGPHGRVVALDSNVRFLKDLAGVEVVGGALEELELEPQSFELVHARYVVIHNANAQELIDVMAASLAPGGWLVLEEPNFQSARSIAGPEGLRRNFDRVNQAILALFTGRGMDPGFGVRLPELLEARGLELALVEEEPHLERGGTPLTRMMRLSTEQLGAKYVETGAAGADDVSGYLEFTRSPACWGVYYSTVAVACRRVG